MSHVLVSDIIAQINQARPGWNRSRSLNLKEEAIQSADTSLAFNAIPTPFAREELVAQAFDYVAANGFQDAGRSYQKLISDTLDIFEIVFNYKLYEDRITFVKCSLKDLNFAEVNEVASYSNPNAITPQHKESFLKKAILAENHPDVMYFVVLDKTKVLAATSLKTIFFTTSWLDLNNGNRDYDSLDGQFSFAKTGENGYFFGSNPVELRDRNEKFREFMCFFLNTNRAVIGDTPIGRYLSGVFGHMETPQLAGYVATAKDTDSLAVRIPYGPESFVDIQYSTRVSPAELIGSDVIKLRYKLNDRRFVTMGPTAQNEIPSINMQALGRLEDPLIRQGDLVREGGRIVFRGTRKTAVESLDSGDILNFDLGVYPFFEYPEEFITQKLETYDIMLVYKFERATPEDTLELRFWDVKTVEGKKILVEIPSKDARDTDTQMPFFVDRKIRTDERNVDENYRTLHYKIFGTNFKYIEVVSKKPREASGLLIPLFEPIKRNLTDKITFAVDFGTTSTHVACSGDEPFRTSQESMVLLHGNPSYDSNIHPVRRYEQYVPALGDDPGIGHEIDLLVDYIQNEFVPSSFDGNIFKFPMRTAVSKLSSCQLRDKENFLLFSEVNIASTYEKEPPRGNNDFIPNIKWSVSDNKLTVAFIEQIVKMCVVKAIGEGYQKSNIEFVSFYPLSIGDIKDSIDQAWKTVCAQYDINSNTSLMTVSESLAPYYANKPDVARCVVSVDIGGGSVDFAIFEDNTPQLVSSVRFGCDVLWGGGKSTLQNDKTNPVFLNFVDKMISTAANSRDENVLKVLMRMLGMNNPADKYADAPKEPTRYSSADIINFWLGNPDFSFSDNHSLKKEFKPAFVAHMYAIMYHIAQEMLANFGKKMLPNAFVFSGNGCKYIDYIGLEAVKEIAASAFALVFYGDNGEATEPGALNTPLTISTETQEESFNKESFIRKLHVSIPDEDHPGKIRTAIGGLHIKKDGIRLQEPENKVYYGELMEEHQTYSSKAKQDLVHYDNINLPRLDEDFVKSICDNVGIMQVGLSNLMNRLQFSDAFEPMDFEHIRTALKESVETNADTSILGTNRDNRIQSSLFFAPVKQLLFEIERKIYERINPIA